MLLALNKKLQKGTTLVESLLAILIMAIVALSGAAFIFFSSIRVNLERAKRAALEMANTRLEELRTSSYASIKPDDNSLHYISKQGGVWVISHSDPGETVDINGVNFPITTSVQYVDDPDISGSADDYLLITVSVGYRQVPDTRVILTSYISFLG